MPVNVNQYIVESGNNKARGEKRDFTGRMSARAQHDEADIPDCGGKRQKNKKKRCALSAYNGCVNLFIGQNI